MIGKRGDLFRGGFIPGGGGDLILPCKNGGGGRGLFRGGFVPGGFDPFP